MIFELAKDFADTLAEMPEENPKRRMLDLLEEAIRRDIHFIARHPTTLFQCMWNTCWWYDCPEAAKHYEEPEGGWNDPLPWERSGSKLSILLTEWRGRRKSTSVGATWVRSLRPPKVHLSLSQVVVLRGHEGGIKNIAVSPNGNVIVSGSKDGTVRLWDTRTGVELSVLEGHEDCVMDVAYSPDGSTVASASVDSTVRLWDVRTGTNVLVLPGHTETVRRVAYSPSGRVVASISHDETIKLWDAQTGELLRILDNDEWSEYYLAFHDETKIITIGGDSPLRHNIVRLRDTECDQELRTFAGCCWVSRPVSGPKMDTLLILFCQDKYLPTRIRFICAQDWREIRSICLELEHMVTGGVITSTGQVVLRSLGRSNMSVCDGSTGKRAKLLCGHEAEVTCLAAVPYSNLVVSGSADGTVRVWDPDMGGEIRWLPEARPSLLEHDTPFNDLLLFTPNCSRVVYGNVNLGTRLWSTEDGLHLAEFREDVHCLALDSDGRFLAEGGKDHAVRLWDPQDGSLLHVLHGHEGWVQHVAFDPRGRYLASASADKSIRLWDVITGRALQTKHCNHTVDDLTWCANGDQIAYTLYGGVPPTRIWHTREDREFSLPSASITFSHDGRLVASGVYPDRVDIWDLASERQRKHLLGSQKSVTDLAFSPDDVKIAVGSKDGSVSIWDVRTGRKLLALRGHEGSVECVAFSHDGRWLASGSDDRTVRVWDVATGQLLQQLSPHGDRVVAAKFGLSDGILLTCERELHPAKETRRTIRVWDMHTGKILESIRGLPQISASQTMRMIAQGHRLKVEKRFSESVIRDTSSGVVAGYFPGASFYAVSPPDARLCVWVMPNYLGITALEGNLPTNKSER